MHFRYVLAYLTARAGTSFSVTVKHGLFHGKSFTAAPTGPANCWASM